MRFHTYLQTYRATTRGPSGPKNRFSFKEARILKGRLQKKRKKTNFDHRQFLRTAHRVSRFRKPRDRAEAILRVLG